MFGDEPTPALAAAVAEQCRVLLETLDREDPSSELRGVALWKLEGYTNKEIADKLAYAERTVANRLELDPVALGGACGTMSQRPEAAPPTSPLDVERLVDAACEHFDQAWRGGGRPAIEPFLEGLGPGERRPSCTNWSPWRSSCGPGRATARRSEEFVDRFPDDASVVAAAFAVVPGPPPSREPAERRPSGADRRG